jgi:IS5 family transposase
LLHGQEEVVFADSGYRGVEKRQEIQDKRAKVDWQIAIMPGKPKALDQTKASHALKDKLEKVKASVRAKVEHPFRVLKCQFGFTKVRYKGLAKNTAQLLTLFALSNLWMARKRIIQGALGWVRLQGGQTPSSSLRRPRFKATKSRKLVKTRFRFHFVNL